MRIVTVRTLIACSIAVLVHGPAAAAELDRSVLPIPEPAPATITTLDARDAKVPARSEVKAPSGAPNVVIVLIDDIGFGHSYAYGEGGEHQGYIYLGRSF